MTCIVGLEHQGAVYLGGDSATMTGWDLSIANGDPKVFTRGGMIIGLSGSVRIAQLLRYALVIPKHRAHVSDMGYMVTDLATAINRMVVEYMGPAAAARDKDEADDRRPPGLADSMILIGYRGALYWMDGDLSVVRDSLGYAAIGCGAAFARGSMFASRDTAMSPTDRIEMALKAASEHSAAVCPPFDILCLAAAPQAG